MQNKIRLIYSNSSLPLSPLIRLVTWSDWSHVAIVLGDRVIEATLSHGGVKETTLDVFQSRAKSWCIMEYDCYVAPENIFNAAKLEEGKKYDWTALIGIIVHNRNWQEDDAWFCSELVAYAFAQAGNPLFQSEEIHRITPQHLWMLYGIEIARS